MKTLKYSTRILKEKADVLLKETEDIESDSCFWKAIFLFLMLFNLTVFYQFNKTLESQRNYEIKSEVEIHNMMMRDFQRSKKQVIVSYYTASLDETDDTPCITADGTNICGNEEKIVACNWLPFDTIVEIDGVDYRVADRMNRRYQKPYMDVLVNTKEEAFEKGRQNKVILIK